MSSVSSRLTLAVIVALGLALTACSTGSGEASSAVPVVTTPTVTATSTLVSTVPTTVVSTKQITSTATETETATKTLTPKPAGTKTVVKTKEVTKTVTKTVTAQPPAPAGSFDDGTYIVGKDINPGTYQASNPNPSGSGLCYWETRTSDGEIGENGVNNGVMFVGSDAFSVRTDGCGTWTPVG